MQKNHKLALITGYYLSRFDKNALNNLGFSTFNEAYVDIGKHLGVKPSTIKNMRDEFDPLHENNRAGWYQRDLRPSRLEVLDKYENISEDALTEIINDIIYAHKENKIVHTCLYTIQSDDKKNDKCFGTRGITGKKAEEIFIEAYRDGDINNYSGSLIDKRSFGCGYDFEVEGSFGIVFEIKGLAENKGCLNFTDKEWNMAKILGDNYLLVLVRNIETKPLITIMVNPYKNLNATKRVYATIAVNWLIESSQLYK